MEYRINSAIKNQIKVSYAIESGEPARSYDVDCGEGINIVMAAPAAQKAFSEIQFDMLRLYPHSIKLKDAIIDYWKDFGSVSRSEIVLADGSISAIYLVNRLFLEAGDRVLGYTPQFSEYGTDVRMRGCEFDSVALKAEDNYRFSAADMVAALRPEHKLVYMDNPNNPTGQIIPLDQISEVLKAAEKMNICVIVDEAYGDYMPRKCSAINLRSQFKNLIVLKTFSKGFGLAGLRAGYAVLPEELSAAMGNINNPYSVSELSRYIAAETIKDAAFLETLRAKNAELKRRLYKPWKNISIAHTDDTVSICMMTHRNPSVDLAEEFARQGILVISGADFCSIGANSVRFRVPSEEGMEKVLEAMRKIDEGN